MSQGCNVITEIIKILYSYNYKNLFNTDISININICDIASWINRIVVNSNHWLSQPCCARLDWISVSITFSIYHPKKARLQYSAAVCEYSHISTHFSDKRLIRSDTCHASSISLKSKSNIQYRTHLTNTVQIILIHFDLGSSQQVHFSVRALKSLTEFTN